MTDAPFVDPYGVRSDPAPVLRDAALDEQLAVQGYVRVKLIEADAARALLDVFHSLRRHPGSGFDPDLTNPDGRYRAEVASTLAPLLTSEVVDLFTVSRPFLWNFLCRWPPDPEDLYLHRDWMFVDERLGRRSHLVWLALQDVTPENGPLHVLPGSHRIGGSLCGTGLLSPWIQHREAIEPHLVSVPLSVGEALVSDHALVHGSARNTTGTPRVAVGCAVRAPHQPLLHFRRVSGSEAVRYDVDETFFKRYTPAQLLDRPPDLEPAERLPAHALPLGRAELSLRLGAAAAPD